MEPAVAEPIPAVVPVAAEPAAVGEAEPAAVEAAGAATASPASDGDADGGGVVVHSAPSVVANDRPTLAPPVPSAMVGSVASGRRMMFSER
ncbi:hypothetical protein Ntsu_57750 [Nocardia sp. IFM 10818]